MCAGRPLAVQDSEVLVQYHQFGLGDEEAGGSFHSLGVAEEGVRVGHGLVAFVSDGNDHYPRIRLESWSHEPSAPPPPWDVEEGIDEVITLPSGVIQLCTLLDGPSGPAFRVGSPGRYQVRIHVRSFMTAVLDGEIDPEDMFVHGAEQWLLRFWPAD
jgi:hypothetical protein